MSERPECPETDTGTGTRARSAADRVVDAVDRLLRALLVVLFAIMLIAALTQIASRELGLGIVGAEEVARYMMIGTAFLALPVLTRTRGNIAVDALAHFLPRGAAQLWSARLVLVVEGAFLLTFANYAYVHTSRLADSGQASVALGLPLWVPATAMPVGGFLAAAVTALLLVRTFRPGAAADPYGTGAGTGTASPGVAS